jgi:hypothetical protein
MGNTKMCLGIIHLYGKKANKEEKKTKEQKYKCSPKLGCSASGHP